MNPNENSATVISQKKDSLSAVVRMLLILAVGLFPIFVLPGSLLSFSHSKSLFLGAFVIISLIVLFFRTIRNKSIVFPKTFFFFAPLILPITYAISASQSINKQLSFFGYGFESDTVFSILIFASFSLLIMGFFYTKKSLKIILSILSASLGFVAVFQLLRLFFPEATSLFGSLPSTIDTLVGRWNDFALLCSMLVIAIFSFLEHRKNSHILSIGLYGLMAFLYFVIIVSGFKLNFGIIQIPLYVFLLGLVLVKFYLFTYKKTNPILSEDGTVRKVNTIPVLSVIVFSAIVFFFGANFSNFASQKLGINYIEGRPSWSATMDVSSDVLKEKSLLGSGPSTFFYDWRQFKPKEFNTTPFWSVDFSYGVGYLPTMVATTGILGLIAWIIFALSSIKVSYKLLKNDYEATHEWNSLRQTVAFLNIFTLICVLVYVPNYSTIVLFFVVYAISVALLVASGNITVKKIDLSSSFPRFSKFSSIFSIILVVSSIVFAYEFGRIIVASALSNRAVLAISKSQFVEANQLAFKAVKVKNLPLYNSILSQVDFLTLRALGAGEKSLETLTEENIKALLGEAVSAALAAESLDPFNTNYTIATGNILAGLGALGAKDGFESALVKFDEASKKTPLDPLPSFLKAQVFLSQKDIEKTKASLLESVSLKPNYTESYVILAQIALLEKDVTKAREYLDLSIASDPQNINLRYERGVDRYSLANFDGAMEDFNAVLGLNNSVANARYFKALSLYRLGKKEEALNELRIVQQTNQDNEELKKTIQMIEASASENTSSEQAEEETEEENEN